MAYQGNYRTWARLAGEDLDDLTAGTGQLFKAVKGVDGKLANDGKTAIGILQYTGKTNEGITLGYDGIQKFVAGAAISSGDALLTVTTSGYFTNAGSGSWVVGKSLSNVASGAVGTGIFNFANPVPFDFSSGYQADFETIEFSAQADLSAAGAVGKGISINDGDFADSSELADGVLVTGTASGSTSICRAIGKVTARAGNVITINRSLKVTSGWFLDADSGDIIVGRSLAASAAGNSGSTFDAVVNFATPHYATSSLDVMY